MKALSIRQPWAWLIVNGHKQFENREWSKGNPGKKFRGAVLIHASKGMTRNEYAAAAAIAEDYDIELPAMGDLQRGGIVGRADVVAWHDSPPDMPFAFTSGLELRNAVPLPFEECTGMLGFFKPGIV
jgi:hypothetical protein